MSGLLLMDVDCPQGTTQIDGVRLRVAQVPYTVLAFAGVSRRTLKVVVRVAYSNGHEPQEREDYERQLSEGQQTAVAIYRTLASCELRPTEQPLLTSCRMSYDPRLFYRPEALPLPLVHQPLAVLAPYANAQTMDDGMVVWYPEEAERERIQREFLAGCGAWDGRRDYIGDYARRLKTDFAEWPQLFHRWFLAMVAQALNLNRDYGNSVIPLLIGTQAMKKSTFCKNILPPSMREYYMDDIKMDNAEQVERVLGRMWLVNIDEYNAKTDREQAKIKRLLTEKDVQIRKMRSDQYTMTPRLCSFIATTNELRPLTDPTGSRRYLCVEMTGQADFPPLSPTDSSPRAGAQGHIPYKQMYAQAVSELRRGERYWFDNDDERLIQEYNRRYQQLSTIDEVLNSLFVTADRSKEHFMTATQIQQHLRTLLKAGHVPSLSKLGHALRRQHFADGARDGVHGYYLKCR